jgi:hypothetical protein
MKNKIASIALYVALVILIAFSVTAKIEINQQDSELSRKDSVIMNYEIRLESIHKKTIDLEKVVEMSRREAERQQAEIAEMMISCKK